VPEIVLGFASQLLYASILISIFCFCKDLYLIYTRSKSHHLQFVEFCSDYFRRMCFRRDDIRKVHYFEAISAGGKYNGSISTTALCTMHYAP
jgi:hypothetical protein